MFFRCIAVLGPTGMKLTFFIAARVSDLCKTVLVTCRCFGYCWIVFAQHRGFLFVSLCPLQRGGWVGQEIGMGHYRDSHPELTQGIFHTGSHHAQQYNWEVLLVLGNWLGISLLVWGGNWWPSHHFFPFLSLTKLSFILTYEFSWFFALPILFPAPPGWWPGEKSAVVWVLSCWPASTHHDCQNSVACSTEAGRNMVVRDVREPYLEYF